MKRLTLFLIVIASTLAFTLTGCAHGDTFAKRTYSSADSKIEAVVIDVIDREIAVSLSDDNQVHIDYYESEKEFYDILVTENNVLQMQYLDNKEITDFIGTKPSKEARKINLQLPLALISNLTISTTNESIKLSPITINDSVTLSSNGGNIELEQINVGNSLTLTAKNGDIKGTVIGSYDMFTIACEIKKGDCNLPLSKPSGNKSLKANCNNGNIKIDFVNL